MNDEFAALLNEVREAIVLSKVAGLVPRRCYLGHVKMRVFQQVGQLVTPADHATGVTYGTLYGLKVVPSEMPGIAVGV